jgi:hypothetical protein
MVGGGTSRRLLQKFSWNSLGLLFAAALTSRINAQLPRDLWFIFNLKINKKKG